MDNKSHAVLHDTVRFRHLAAIITVYIVLVRASRVIFTRTHAGDSRQRNSGRKREICLHTRRVTGKLPATTTMTSPYHDNHWLAVQFLYCFVNAELHYNRLNTTINNQLSIIYIDLSIAGVVVVY